jgi:hypothetical protein
MRTARVGGRGLQVRRLLHTRTEKLYAELELVRSNAARQQVAQKAEAKAELAAVEAAYRSQVACSRVCPARLSAIT